MQLTILRNAADVPGPDGASPGYLVWTFPVAATAAVGS
jgi:hypothetical protein